MGSSVDVTRSWLSLGCVLSLSSLVDVELMAPSPCPCTAPKQDESEPLLEEKDPLIQVAAADDDDGEEEHINIGRARLTSTTATFINLLKSYIGSGLLGLPFAFRQSGILAGVIIMVCVMVMSTHTMLILVKCKQLLAHKGIVAFSDIAHHVSGKWTSRAVDALLCFTQFGFASVYMVYVSENIAHYFDDTMRVKALILLGAFPVFLGLAYIRTLKYVGPASLLANICIGFGAVILITVSCYQIANHVIPGLALDVQWYVNPSDLPIFFGMAVYSAEGIGLVLPSETAMRSPHKFPRVLVGVAVVSTFMYLLFGTVPYLAFGPETKDSLIDNFADFAKLAPNSDAWERLQTVTRFSLIVAILFTYPVQLFVVTDIIEEEMFKPGRLSTRNKNVKIYGFRTFLVVLGSIIALTVPKFGLLISLIGSAGGSALQFVFPCMFYLKLKPEMGNAMRCLMYFYIFVGIGGGGLGTAYTLKKLIEGD